MKNKMNELQKSERQDLNLRPLRPERSALAKLSYSPGWDFVLKIRIIWKSEIIIWKSNL